MGKGGEVRIRARDVRVGMGKGSRGRDWTQGR